MGWRIICIENAIRINYRLNSIGILNDSETIWINLDEIDTIIVETQACNTSIKLLSELAKKGISMIVCSDNHQPIGQLLSLTNNQRSAKYNKMQLEWSHESKKEMWKRIVSHKILLQMVNLYKNNKTGKIDMIKEHLAQVEPGDLTNREGIVAKVYFHELFGLDFVRTRNAEDIINSSLNYIYQIVRAKISQEIVAHGYITSLGIFHCSEYNFFGLSDDIIEVYRPILDYYVIKLVDKEKVTFMSSYYKEKLLEIMYEYILFDNKKQKIIDTISLVVISITDSLSLQQFDNIKFPYFYDENK